MADGRLIAPKGKQRSWGYSLSVGDRGRFECGECTFRAWAGPGVKGDRCPRCGGSLALVMRRRELWKSGFEDRAAAAAALARVKSGLLAGTHADPSKLTVAAWFREWMEGDRFRNLRPSTAAGYRQQITAHVLPGIGAHKLQRLRSADLSRFYADLLAGGRLRAGSPGLAPSSVAYVASIVKVCLEDARSEGLIERSPADNVRRPRKGEPEHATWEPEQARAFLERAEAEGSRLAVLWRFLAFTGCRRGEALGLTWDALTLDGDAPSARIERQITAARGQLIEGPPKTRRGVRSVPLDFDGGGLVDALRKLRARQAAERLAAGGAYTDRGLVFARPDGSPLDPQGVSEAFGTAVLRAGLAPIRLHDLRHSLASLMLSAGVPVTDAAAILGHSPAVCLSVYGHALAGSDRRAVATVAARLRGIG